MTTVPATAASIVRLGRTHAQAAMTRLDPLRVPVIAIGRWDVC